MVKTGPEKKMAVESPMGRRSTDSLISQRKIPPRIPWATSLHRVAMSGGPSGEELVNHMMLHPKCGLCSKNFSNDKTLKIHLSKVHETFR